MSPLAAVKAVCAVTVMVAVAAVAAAPKARDDILMDDQTEDGVVDQDEEALPFIRVRPALWPFAGMAPCLNRRPQSVQWVVFFSGHGSGDWGPSPGVGQQLGDRS